MKPLIFSTGNAIKFALGRETCAAYGITLEQNTFDIDELQGEDATKIVTAKAWAAYVLVGQPVVVSDDSWDIPALNGFPGPYMKSVNHWFRPGDFIHLTAPFADKRIHLHAYLAYCDGDTVTISTRTQSGILTDVPRGETGPPIMKVVAMDIDKGLTIAEICDRGIQNKPERLLEGNPWHDFAAWYTSR